LYLVYFDETKFETSNPFFYIGGILIKDNLLSFIETEVITIQEKFFGSSLLTKDNELHGKLIFQGKGPYRKRKLSERIQLFQDVANIIIGYKIPVIMIRIDVIAHKNKYRYPAKEYEWGLQLFLERVADFLEQHQEIGIVFGDYEKDEITKAVINFSQFKSDGKTPLAGRSLSLLKDTIYFTQSHHSRFLQMADMVLYMANRYENGHNTKTWHDKKLKEIWGETKEKTDIKIQYWPNQIQSWS